MTRDEQIEVMAREIEDILLTRLHKGTLDGYTLEASTDMARGALAALEDKGLCVVPRKPTPAMEEAGDDGHYGMTGAEVYAAMLAVVLKEPNQ